MGNFSKRVSIGHGTLLSGGDYISSSEPRPNAITQLSQSAKYAEQKLLVRIHA